MTRSELESTVRRILETALARPIDSAEEVSQHTEDVWDSVKHIEILFMLEEELGIRFAESELAHLNSMRGIIDRAARQLGIGDLPDPMDDSQAVAKR